MSRVGFDVLPEDARVWIFSAERELTAVEQERVLADVDRFIDESDLFSDINSLFVLLINGVHIVFLWSQVGNCSMANFSLWLLTSEPQGRRGVQLMPL